MEQAKGVKGLTFLILGEFTDRLERESGGLPNLGPSEFKFYSFFLCKVDDYEKKIRT